MEEKWDSMNVVGAIKDLWLIQNVVGFVSIMAHNPMYKHSAGLILNHIFNPELSFYIFLVGQKGL
jgi:hypothetical protein